MMNRTDILNNFIEARGLQSYLEVGADQGYDLVKCTRKVGVSPWPVEANGIHFLMQSDDFFDGNEEFFDLVFVGSSETELQADRDLSNAVLSLNHGGVAVLSPCLSGEAWKAILRYFNSSPYLCYIVDCDQGCGVIDTSETSRKPMLQLPAKLSHDQHFGLLQRYVITPEEFETLLSR